MAYQIASCLLAEHIRAVPRPRARAHTCEAFTSVEVVRGGAIMGLEDLAEWCSEVLREACGGAVGDLGDEDAIAVVGIAPALAIAGRGQGTIEGVVGSRERAGTCQVARRVVDPANHLVRRVVAAALRDSAVDLYFCLITDHVILEGCHDVCRIDLED